MMLLILQGRLGVKVLGGGGGDGEGTHEIKQQNYKHINLKNIYTQEALSMENHAIESREVIDGD